MDDGTLDNEDSNRNLVDVVVDIVDIEGLTTMDEDGCFDNVDVLKGSSTPMDQTLTHLHETMAEITTECTFCLISHK